MTTFKTIENSPMLKSVAICKRKMNAKTERKKKQFQIISRVPTECVSCLSICMLFVICGRRVALCSRKRMHCKCVMALNAFITFTLYAIEMLNTFSSDATASIKQTNKTTTILK